ncbi:ATP-binding cassette domain-containing protein [Loktanella sp. S4079]|uniref:ATP-binding cassette domain-containing protein n=1 Tax=Loktanella sp. S4079 TaxID=579483 RepID=UPI0005FA627B|nr:ATP-binding cassette domain-containing protein [Loktanella sp. S4079]KJZ20231.1 ABC transporter ATP-binding protein [Loktanella sp. S4079]
MIRVNDVNLSRGGVEILRQVSLEIPKGGIVAIVGPNGAGKSSLLHVIAGLVQPDSGQVTIDGQDLHQLGEQARARVLAFLTQNQGAVPRLTVRDLVAFGRWPHHRGRLKAEDHAAIADALSRFDLETLAQRDIETLSGGQKQRAFVAMCYAQTTPWMLLDEPLAALDPKYTRDIMERLQGLEDRTVLLVLHDLSIAANYADWVVAVKDGCVHSVGPCQDMITSERLTDLYDVPLELAEVNGKSAVIWR